MGASQSKLEQLSVDDVSSYVTKLGVKYRAYGDSIAENAVDGEVLASIQGEEEMKETMECLDITNFLHQKVLLKEWCKAKGIHKPRKAAQRSLSGSYSSVASELTLDTDLSTALECQSSIGTSTNSLPYARPLGSVEPLQMPRTPCSPPDIPCSISVEHQRMLEPLNLPKDASILPADSPELEPFQQVAKQALQDCFGSFAETNLVDITHFENKKGMNNLVSVFPPETNLPPARCHFDQPNDLEVCRRFVLGQDDEYYEEYVPAHAAMAAGLSEAARYYGHVVRLGNLRVGNICVMVEERHWHKESDDNRKKSLQFLASVMEQQLQRRQVLLQRNQNLKQDIEQLKNSGVDQVLAPPYGPVKAVLSSQVASRPSLFPYPNEQVGCGAAGQDNGHPTFPHYNRRSAHLPAWQFAHQASTRLEQSHLPSDYFLSETESLLGQPMDRTPIGKNDLERVAMLNSLQVLQLDPTSQEGQTIQSLLTMAATLLGADLVFLSILDHQHRYILFPTHPNNAPDFVSQKTKQFMTQTHQVVQRHPHTGKPCVLRSDRDASICNYTVMSPNHQAFVVHDVAKDQSLALYKELADLGFYSGASIVLRGYAIGVLCVTNLEARPDFGRAQEVQQEQLAGLIAQQYDTWALKREMMQLERERTLLVRATGTTASSATTTTTAASSVSTGKDIQSLCKMRANRPEDYAALIFTSIQGAAALATANPQVFQQAVELHNRTMRVKIAEHGGYEVSEEEGNFHVAFTDVVDAVRFSLQVQEALHQATWAMELLVLPEACEDAVRCFRGLRVSMAVHCGDVDTVANPVSGDMTYVGETLHITKGLEGMSHGGQILVTSDVWNVASHLVDGALGSPQVIDLGTHVMPSKSGKMRDGITRKKVLQLVPKCLAHDYNQSRMLGQGNGRVLGRVFPNIKTKKSVSPSFHSAPHEDNKVCLLAVDTSDMEGLTTDFKMLLMGVSNRINTMLSDGTHSGYQCNDFLLAFDEAADAVRFGLALQESLATQDIQDISLKGKVKIGVHEGTFKTMRPNRINGRAEYVGQVVRNVSLIAEASAPGCVYLGKVVSDGDDFLMPATNGFMVDFHGQQSLQADDQEFVLHKCQPCKSWYDQMLDNRRCNLSAPWRG